MMAAAEFHLGPSKERVTPAGILGQPFLMVVMTTFLAVTLCILTVHGLDCLCCRMLTFPTWTLCAVFKKEASAVETLGTQETGGLGQFFPAEEVRSIISLVSQWGVVCFCFHV